MNDDLRDAIRSLVVARLAGRAGPSGVEDAAAMAAEAIALAEQIEAFRPLLQPSDSPEAFTRLLDKGRRE